MPVATKMPPVMMPELCSRLCQLSFKMPLYASLTHNTMPVTDIIKYIAAMSNTAQIPFVPANKK